MVVDGVSGKAANQLLWLPAVITLSPIKPNSYGLGSPLDNGARANVGVVANIDAITDLGIELSHDLGVVGAAGLGPVPKYYHL